MIYRHTWAELKPLDIFEELLRSAVFSVLDEELVRPEFQQHLKRLYLSINRKIWNLIIETDIETFEVEMMPYEIEAFQEMKPADPEA